MSEHESDHAGSDHMGAVRRDEPLPEAPAEMATPDTGDVRKPSADVERDAAYGDRSHEDQVDADAGDAEDVTERLSGGE